MALNQTSYTVKLIDKASKPARRIATEMGRIARAEQAMQRSQAGAARVSRMEQRAHDQRIRNMRAQKRHAMQVRRQAMAEERHRVAMTRAGLAREAAVERRRASMQRRAIQRARFMERSRGGGRGDGGGIGGAAGFLGMGLGGAVAMGGAALAAGGAMAGRAVTQAALGREQKAFTLDRIGGGGMAGLDALNREAASLGLNIDVAFDAYRSMLSMGFDRDASMTWVRLGADMQAIGASADDVQGALRAVSQISAKGRLQAEELLQLAERGISQKDIWQRLAEIRGKGESIDEIRKLQERGEIGSDIALQAIQQSLMGRAGSTEAGEAGRRRTRTTAGGAIDRLKATSQAGLERIASRMLPSLIKGVTALTEGFERFFESERGQAFIGGLTSAVESFGASLQLIGEYLPVITDNFVNGFMKGLGVMDASAEKGQFMQSILELMAGGAEGFGEKLGNVLLAVQTLADAISGVVDLMKTVGLINPVGEMGANHGEAAHTEGMTLGSAVLAGLKLGMPHEAMWTYGKLMFSAMNAGFRSVAEIHSPSRAMRDNGRYLSEGLEQGMTQYAADPVSMMDGGMAGVRPALAAASGGGGGGVSVGDITINVQGGESPQATAQATLAAFESQLSAVLGRVQSGAFA